MPPKSDVWAFFARDQKKNVAKCLTCGQEYKTSGNTSNLRDHMISKHPSLWKKRNATECHENSEHEDDCDNPVETVPKKKAKTSSIVPFVTQSLKYDNNSPEKVKLDRMLSLMVATDYQPFTLVNDVGFRNFVNVLNPRYTIPSKNTVKNIIKSQLYNECKAKLQTLLNQAESVSLTTDCWTSRTTESYLTITCHFIDPQYKIINAVLSTRECINHNADSLAHEIKCTMHEWDIGHKVTCIVTDNAENMIKTCQILEIRHHPCFAHSLNLVVTDALRCDTVQPVINKCKDLVRFLKKSNTASNKLLELQCTDGVLTPLKVIQEVPTRWNSCLAMLRRLVHLKKYVVLAVACLAKSPAPPTSEDFDIMDDLITLLTCFEKATTISSGSTYVTLSLIIPTSFDILNKIRSVSISTDQGKQTFSILEKSIQDRLSRYEERTLPRLATLIDPRLKKEAFRFEHNAKGAIDLFELELNRAIHPVLTAREQSPQPSTSATCSTTQFHFEFMKDRIDRKVEYRSNFIEAKIVIKQYFEKRHLDMEKDPLEYWKQYAMNPEDFALCTLAKKYLAVPATSVPSERIFSKAGSIVTDKRARLKPSTVDSLVFLNANKFLLE